HVAAAHDRDVLPEVQTEPVLLVAASGRAAFARGALVVVALSRLAISVGLAGRGRLTRALAAADQADLALVGVFTSDAPGFVAARGTVLAPRKVRRAFFFCEATVGRRFAGVARGRRGRVLARHELDRLRLGAERIHGFAGGVFGAHVQLERARNAGGFTRHLTAERITDLLHLDGVPLFRAERFVANLHAAGFFVAGALQRDRAQRLQFAHVWRALQAPFVARTIVSGSGWRCGGRCRAH